MLRLPMITYLPEFLAIVVMHALAVVSPGPDFAMVLRQSLRHGRTTALWTSVGIGCGLLTHITYSLLGLGLFLKNSATALLVAKWLGAAYLAWIGIQALRARPREAEAPVGRSLSPTSSDPVGHKAGPTVPTPRAAWTTGFLVNALNPKAAFFFLSLFPLAVSAGTPRWVQVGYGVWMTVTTIAWFGFVSVVFAREEVRRAFLCHGHWIDRALGVVFLGFAASLLLFSVN
jgi:threonine/homoserine/homoserine lactone efflux protein